jgi:hypothetical protein
MPPHPQHVLRQGGSPCGGLKILAYEMLEVKQHLHSGTRMAGKSGIKHLWKCIRIHVCARIISEQVFAPQVRVKFSLCLTKYHAMKTYPVLD